MSGIWLPSIHVENHLNPGVPDLSYVMLGGEYETGWLELKAVEDAPTITIHVEPSQHRWIEAHCASVPVHLLLRVGRVAYLVCGSMHRRFLKSVTHEDLRSIALVGFQVEAMRAQLNKYLKEATFRGRYEQK